MKSHENPFSRSGVVTCGQRDRQTDGQVENMAKPIGVVNRYGRRYMVRAIAGG